MFWGKFDDLTTIDTKYTSTFTAVHDHPASIRLIGLLNTITVKGVVNRHHSRRLKLTKDAVQTDRPYQLAQCVLWPVNTPFLLCLQAGWAWLSSERDVDAGTTASVSVQILWSAAQQQPASRGHWFCRQWPKHLFITGTKKELPSHINYRGNAILSPIQAVGVTKHKTNKPSWNMAWTSFL